MNEFYQEDQLLDDLLLVRSIQVSLVLIHDFQHGSNLHPPITGLGVRTIRCDNRNHGFILALSQSCRVWPWTHVVAGATLSLHGFDMIKIHLVG